MKVSFKHTLVQHEKPSLSTLSFNKAPLQPITASEVQERSQLDLVDFSDLPVEVEPDGLTCRYVLSVLDVFSRHLFLRPLSGNSPYLVAQELIDIFYIVSPPRIIQTDQGTEFRGMVEMLSSAMNITVIRSRPYHPQSQGKVESIYIPYATKALV
ncbi:KRAB-A domain-containing protein 2-like [Corticium candelabrum]|uniref:KRAB-A domain-containing protein 2-like n=1 Tax=Corticium candelabrum TaxID=121492 RepID=UPI002E26FA7A|nr:KRAB-A domain-containing protein 2-like [Corticium candelabrum]